MPLRLSTWLVVQPHAALGWPIYSEKSEYTIIYGFIIKIAGANENLGNNEISQSWDWKHSGENRDYQLSVTLLCWIWNCWQISLWKAAASCTHMLFPLTLGNSSVAGQTSRLPHRLTGSSHFGPVCWSSLKLFCQHRIAAVLMQRVL